MRAAFIMGFLSLASPTLGQTTINPFDVSVTITTSNGDQNLVQDFEVVSVAQFILGDIKIDHKEISLLCSRRWPGVIAVYNGAFFSVNERATSDLANSGVELSGEDRKVIPFDSPNSPLSADTKSVRRLADRASRQCGHPTDADQKAIEERKAKVAATAEAETSRFDTPGKMQRITKALTRAKKKWEGMGDELCNSPDSCMVFVGNFQILATGGVVTVMVSSQETIEDYVDVCSVVLAGLGNMKRRTAYSYVLQSFQDASIAGRGKYNAGGVEIRVKPSFDDRLECSFFQR